MKINIRDNQKTSLTNHYVRINETKIIYIGGNLRIYNLSELLRKYNCNIIKKINVMYFDNEIHNIIEYSLICNNVKITNITNKSFIIHNYNIIDYLYNRFIDIDQLVADLYLHIDYVNFNNQSKIKNQFLSCEACNCNIKLKKYNIPKNIIEEIYFYKPIEYYKDLNKNITIFNSKNWLSIYSIIDEKTSQIEIITENYYSKIYFCLLWTLQNNDKYPEIESINVNIDNIKFIEDTSSQIYINNKINLHHIDLFPYNNDLFSDFIPKYKNIKIKITFKNEYSFITKICLGLIKLLEN